MNEKRVLVAMSGGVDSSVAAALLQKNGYKAVGVHFQFWQNPVKSLHDHGASADNYKNISAENDVKRIAKILGIPLIIVDARKEFKSKVVKYFLDEYKKGRTPNPCVFCNENLKFKLLFELARKRGIEYVATGHYARLRRERKTQNAKRKTKEKYFYKLFEAKDKNKDQSYFLYRLKQNQLARLVFPLGEYQKEEVRKMAKKMNLPVWEKKESQDICFLGSFRVADFLKKNIKSKKGNIITEKGKIIGQHDGLSFYTLGQREGIKIGGTGPYFVISKNYRKNQLIVANNKEDLPLFSKKAILKEVNWIHGQPIFPAKVWARNRYRDPISKAHLETKNRKKIIINYKNPQRSLTPGQSTVFYSKKGEVLGGGIVEH